MRARFALALLLAGVANHAARADDSFDAFRQFCVASHAEETQALAAADKAGWMPLPQMLIDQFPKGQILQPKGRLRTTEAAMMMLIVGRGPVPASNVEGRVCAVAILPGDLAALESQAGEFAQVPKDPSGLLYVWREDNGAHVAVGQNTPDLRALVESGAVNFMMTRGNDKMALILLMVPAK